jgi:hypothetical protein
MLVRSSTFAQIVIAAVIATACATNPTPSPLVAPTASSGPLYVPRAVQAAYRKGTRSPDGRPGPNYWQNRARYSIAVTALPPDRTVRGTEQIVYYNNSPDTLRNPQIKLFMNIHMAGAPRSFGAPPEYLTSGVHIDSVSANQQPVKWNIDNAFTEQRLPLPQALLPHDSVRLSFKWHYDMSKLS